MAQRYETYKDSSVQWLGEIPGHWGCVAIGRVSNVILGKMLQNEPKGNTDTLIPYLCAKDVHFDGVDVSDLKQMYFSDIDLNHYAVQQGDMLIVEGGAGAGNCAILRQTISTIGIQNSIMIVRGGEKIVNSYTCYFLSNIVQKGYVDFVTNVATIPHFTKEKVCRTSVPLPPLPEQHAIVSYLDDKCGKIDEWIAQKQKEVELLGEMKQRVIADAVTRGLDPNVKMKRTNIPWLPEVPEHWDSKRGKNLFTVINECSTTGQEELLTVSDRTGITPRSMKNVTMFMSESLIGYKKCQIGDICSNIMWMWHGAVGVTKYEGVISPSYVVYRQKNNYYINEYLDNLLRLPQLVKLYAALSKGLTESRLRLYPDAFLNILFIIPPLSEQHAIVSHITAKTAKIDKLVENVTREIDNLKEYKQRLISDVVTGQIKVC